MRQLRLLSKEGNIQVIVQSVAQNVMQVLGEQSSILKQNTNVLNVVMYFMKNTTNCEYATASLVNILKSAKFLLSLQTTLGNV